MTAFTENDPRLDKVNHPPVQALPSTHSGLKLAPAPAPELTTAEAVKIWCALDAKAAAALYDRRQNWRTLPPGFDGQLTPDESALYATLTTRLLRHAQADATRAGALRHSGATAA